MRSFAEGCDELERLVGHGKLVGTLKIDQVYAASQHAGTWVTGPLAGHVIRNHPKGGQTHYLEEPLFAEAEDYMHNLAESFPDFMVQAMAENMEDLSDQVHEHAPRENDILRNSGNPIVTSEGAEIYNRPPLFPRLSEEDLKDLHRR